MIDTNDIRERLRNYNVSDEELLSLCDEIDRLRGEKQTPQHGKTVRVTTRVAVDVDGKWADLSGSWASLNDEYKVYTLTAELPVPEEVTVEAEVENA